MHGRLQPSEVAAVEMMTREDIAARVSAGAQFTPDSLHFLDLYQQFMQTQAPARTPVDAPAAAAAAAAAVGASFARLHDLVVLSWVWGVSCASACACTDCYPSELLRHQVLIFVCLVLFANSAMLHPLHCTYR